MPQIKPNKQVRVHVYPRSPENPNGRVVEVSKNIQRLESLARSLAARQTVVLTEMNGRLVPKPVEIDGQLVPKPAPEAKLKVAVQKAAATASLESTRDFRVDEVTGEVSIRESLNNEVPGWLPLIPIFDQEGKLVAILDGKKKPVRVI